MRHGENREEQQSQALQQSAAVNGKTPAAVRDHESSARSATTDESVATLLKGQALAVGNLNRAALRLVKRIHPRNEIEGMLAVQMSGAYSLAVEMLRRAQQTDRVDFLAVYGNLAAKLLRVFAAQTEALARLRGQTGQQVVRVEHVTVEAGGQAVVGAISTGGTGDDTKI